MIKITQIIKPISLELLRFDFDNSFDFFLISEFLLSNDCLQVVSECNNSITVKFIAKDC